MHKPFTIHTFFRWARQQRFRSGLPALLLATFLSLGAGNLATASVADTDTVEQVAKEIDARLEEMDKTPAGDDVVRATL